MCDKMNSFNKLKPYLDKQNALFTALTLFEWDNATKAPEKAIDNTSAVMGILSDEYYNALINDDVAFLLNTLCKEQLSALESSIVKELKNAYDDVRPIPQAEYSAYKALTAKASSVWQKAKKNNDYALFAPVLKEIIDYKKKFAAYKAKDRGYNGPLYDILLDEYEKGFNTQILDTFFNRLKDTIIPLVRMVSKKSDKIDKHYNELHYDIDKQREVSHRLAKYIGFDFTKGVMLESAHPFTTNLHNRDVRITTAFFENNLESAMFSTIHEGGHALYEMHIDDALTMTPVGTGTSMGFHEGQSRLFENNIGRSRAFWTPLYPQLQETFKEQLNDITLDHFILGINKSQPSPIRTEADELTYCLHIIIRYEIEKYVINNDFDIDLLPKLWNDKYEEYLGIRPENDSEGILQDIHWSCGDFGYFPSYAIGTAIAAQIYAHLKTAINIDECLEKGNFAAINDYLKEHLHRFGKTKTTNELLSDMMGENFNPQYYIDYLNEKYTALYSRL